MLRGIAFVAALAAVCIGVRRFCDAVGNLLTTSTGVEVLAFVWLSLVPLRLLSSGAISRQLHAPLTRLVRRCSESKAFRRAAVVAAARDFLVACCQGVLVFAAANLLVKAVPENLTFLLPKHGLLAVLGGLGQWEAKQIALQVHGFEAVWQLRLLRAFLAFVVLQSSRFLLGATMPLPLVEAAAASTTRPSGARLAEEVRRVAVSAVLLVVAAAFCPSGIHWQPSVVALAFGLSLLAASPGVRNLGARLLAQLPVRAQKCRWLGVGDRIHGEIAGQLVSGRVEAFRGLDVELALDESSKLHLGTATVLPHVVRRKEVCGVVEVPAASLAPALDAAREALSASPLTCHSRWWRRPGQPEVVCSGLDLQAGRAELSWRAWLPAPGRVHSEEAVGVEVAAAVNAAAEVGVDGLEPMARAAFAMPTWRDGGVAVLLCCLAVGFRAVSRWVDALVAGHPAAEVAIYGSSAVAVAGLLRADALVRALRLGVLRFGGSSMAGLAAPCCTAVRGVQLLLLVNLAVNAVPDSFGWLLPPNLRFVDTMYLQQEVDALEFWVWQVSSSLLLAVLAVQAVRVVFSGVRTWCRGPLRGVQRALLRGIACAGATAVLVDRLCALVPVASLTAALLWPLLLLAAAAFGAAQPWAMDWLARCWFAASGQLQEGDVVRLPDGDKAKAEVEYTVQGFAGSLAVLEPRLTGSEAEESLGGAERRVRAAQLLSARHGDEETARPVGFSVVVQRRYAAAVVRSLETALLAERRVRWTPTLVPSVRSVAGDGGAAANTVEVDAFVSSQARELPGAAGAARAVRSNLLLGAACTPVPVAVAVSPLLQPGQ